MDNKNYINIRIYILGIYKSVIKLIKVINGHIDRILVGILLYVNNIKFSSFRTTGIPYIQISYRNGKMTIGKDFAMNNGLKGNPIGYNERCSFVVYENSNIIIGDNVGISQCALVSHSSIIIGNNVKIGGGTCIYTSDFHSLDYRTRKERETDIKNKKCAPVIIKDHVFIGARCLILKGVTIGEHSIVGAGSVVSKSIPDNEIWAGNPAKFIRKIEI